MNSLIQYHTLIETSSFFKMWFRHAWTDHKTNLNIFMILINRQSLHFRSKSVTILALVTRIHWFYIRSTQLERIISLIRYLESITLPNLKKTTMLYLFFVFSSFRTETVDAFLGCFALWWLRDGLMFRLRLPSRYLRGSMREIYRCCYGMNILLNDSFFHRRQKKAINHFHLDSVTSKSFTASNYAVSLSSIVHVM